MPLIMSCILNGRNYQDFNPHIPRAMCTVYDKPKKTGTPLHVPLKGKASGIPVSAMTIAEWFDGVKDTSREEDVP